MWTDDAGLAAAERRIDDWESSLAERAERSRALSQRLSGLTASAPARTAPSRRRWTPPAR